MGFLIKGLLGIFGGTANVVLSTLLSIVKTVGGEITSLARQGANAVMQYHQEGISFARSLGMTLKESQSYTSVLIDRASELGIKYGIAADKVLELQRNLSEATGRAAMLNNSDAERLVQINKLVGSDVTSVFTSTIMNNLGGQISTVEGAVSKAYATAAKSGLNAASFSKKVADNLALANQYSFRDGVDGITRMTAMSEKLGVNMKSISASIDHFLDLTDAIEGSAKLNMLGGAAAVNGSNPLTMSYEANYDPEAFLERMKDTLGGYASFDTKSGMATVNGMNRDFVANIAKAIGISLDDAMTMAKKQAEAKYKESAFGGQLSLYSQEEKDFILNKSYVGEDGQLKMTDSMGRERNVNDLSSSGELSKMMTMSNMSNDEIIRSQASSLVSIQESIEGIRTSITADAAKAFQEVLPSIQSGIYKLGGYIQHTLQPLWGGIANGVKSIVDYLNGNTSIIRKGFGIVEKIFSTLSSNFKTVIAAIIGYKLLGGLRGISNAFRSGYRFFGGPSIGGGSMGAGSTVKNIALKIIGSKPFNFLSAGQTRNIISNYSFARNVGGYGRVRSALGAIGSGLKSASKVTKAAGALGVLFGGIESLRTAGEYYSTKNDLDERLRSGSINRKEYDSRLNEAKTERNGGYGSVAGGVIGSAIGTALAGPIGTAIGGFLGGKVGDLIGRHWDGITKTVSNGTKTAFNAVKSGMSSFGKWLSSAVKSLGRGVVSALKGYLNAMAIIPRAIMSPIQTAKSLAKDGLGSTIGKLFKGGFATGGIVGGNSYHGDNVRANVNSGEMILTMPQQRELFNILNNKYSSSSIFSRSSSVVGGNSYHGDNVRANVNSGEMILTMPQQRELFNILNNKYSSSSIFSRSSSVVGGNSYHGDNVRANANSGGVKPVLYNSSNGIKAKPVGGKVYVYKPSKSSLGDTSRDVKINDFNVNISGIIKLDGGRNTRDIDISKLLSNQEFVSSLKEMIKTSINNDINCGKLMNDDALRRGMPAQTALWGRK